MSKFQDLVKRLAPDGVRYRKLGEIAEYSKTRVDAHRLDATNFVGVDNLVSNRGGRVDSKRGPNTDRVTAYETGDVLLGNIRPYLKKVWAATDSGGCSGDVLAIRIRDDFRPGFTPEFLYCVLSSDQFFEYNNRNAKGAKMPRGDKRAILDYRVPVPPLEVQNLTVDLMSHLSSVSFELQQLLREEAAGRQEQAARYRQEALRRAERFERVAISDVADFLNAKAHEKLVTPEGDVALLTAKFISTSGREARYVPSRDVLTPALTGDVALVMSDLPNGRALARTFYVDENGKFAANQRVCLLRSRDHNVLVPRFLFHVMNRNPQLLAYNNGIDQTHLKKGSIQSATFGLPPLEEQIRVISLLDGLDETVSALVESAIPSEIEVRQREYALYGRALLNLKELAS